MASNSKPWMRLVTQRGEGDCAVAVLAMYLDVTYEDALAALTKGSNSHKVHRKGAWFTTLKRGAAVLGVDLVVHRRVVDLDTDNGILRLDDHVVILLDGHIIDPNGSIWKHDVYFANFDNKTRVQLITRRGE